MYFISKKKENLKLLVPYIDKKKIQNIKKSFAIKYDFEIISIFEKSKELNFFKRLYFGYKCLKKIRENKDINLVISRSVITGVILAFSKIKSYTEIHTELKGFTKYFFLLTKLKFISKNLRFILINKYLLNFFKLSKKKYIILDDAVNNELFKDKRRKKFKNTCAYFGSLTKGKGVEIISKISKLLKNINFHVYGDIKLISNKNIIKVKKNVKFFNYIKYSKIPDLMSRYEILLMPYQRNVYVRSKNLDAAKYMSPLKLFEYLAMSKIVIASNLKVYSHILKNNKNSILVDPDNEKLWAKKIQIILNNLNKFKYLKKNALLTSRKFTWEKRVDIILKNNRSFLKKSL